VRKSLTILQRPSSEEINASHEPSSSLHLGMAEIGAIATIVGIAGAGAKLSIVLFEFASQVGSAGLEIRQIGTEISPFLFGIETATIYALESQNI
jgi:hypothetical protein